MTISLTINAASVSELHAQMAALLGSGATAPAPQANVEPPKRQTAAERKAAEKAEADAKAAAEAAAKAATPEGKTAEQRDAKDEAAEQPAPVTLSHDSVRSMLGLYVQAYGMEAAQEDGPKIIGSGKISELANDQPVLAKAVLAIAEAVEKNPHKRALKAEMEDIGAKAKELAPVVNAARAVK